MKNVPFPVANLCSKVFSVLYLFLCYCFWLFPLCLTVVLLVSVSHFLYFRLFFYLRHLVSALLFTFLPHFFPSSTPGLLSNLAHRYNHIKLKMAISKKNGSKFIWCLMYAKITLTPPTWNRFISLIYPTLAGSSKVNVFLYSSFIVCYIGVWVFSLIIYLNNWRAILL